MKEQSTILKLEFKEDTTDFLSCINHSYITEEEANKIIGVKNSAQEELNIPGYFCINKDRTILIRIKP